jgi:hypothetical protein
MDKRIETRPPWKKKNPKAQSKRLTAVQKQEARVRARRAGRKYPNLVDNMAVARKKRKTVKNRKAAGKAGPKKAAPKKTARKTAK